MPRLRPTLTLLTPLLLILASCAPPTPDTPRPTAATILEITIAPTQDVDATATAYARVLVPSPTPAGLYVVQRGDTLSGIAEDFGTTVEEIMVANNLTDSNALQAGQILLIPSLISDTLTLATPGLPAGTTVATTTTTITSTATLATPSGKPTPTPASPKGTPTPTLSSP